MFDKTVKPNESEIQYIWRLGQAKDSGVINDNWEAIASLINSVFRKDETEYRTESAYRKMYQEAKRFYNEGIFTSLSVQRQIEELEKEKVKIRDERNEYKKLIREQARQESYADQLVRNIKTHCCQPLEYDKAKQFTGVLKCENDLLIPLFDLHVGMKSDNFWNKYNEEIFKSRLNKYLDRIFDVQLRNGCENAYVVISEVISGYIHPTIRIENNQDVIEQFLTAVDYLSEFLTELSYHFEKVHVYVAPGNHSRLTPNKDNNLDHENLDNLLIPFFEAKLQNFDNIYCHKNNIEHSLAMFNIRGQIIYSSHGDKESLDTAVEKLTMFTRTKPDIYLCGHRHTNAMRTEYDTKCIQSGSMSGSDSYCMEKRLQGRPEQTLCVVDAEGLVCIYDVRF